jgi:hypothetical protein
LLIGFLSGGAQLGSPGNEILQQTPTRNKSAPPTQQKEWIPDQMDQLKAQLESRFNVTENHCSERPIVLASAESMARAVSMLP